MRVNQLTRRLLAMPAFREAVGRSGISPGFLCEMCQGRAAPSRTVAERIIEVLELDEAEACDLLEASVGPE